MAPALVPCKNGSLYVRKAKNLDLGVLMALQVLPVRGWTNVCTLTMVVEFLAGGAADVDAASLLLFLFSSSSLLFLFSGGDSLGCGG